MTVEVVRRWRINRAAASAVPIAMAAGAYWWWCKNSGCSCGHTCELPGWNYMRWMPCQMCDDDVSSPCGECPVQDDEDLETPGGDKRRKRKRRENVLADIVDGYNQWKWTLVLLGGLDLYRGGEVLGRAGDTLVKCINDFLGLRAGGRFQQFTSGQAARAQGGNWWQNFAITQLDWKQAAFGLGSVLLAERVLGKKVRKSKDVPPKPMRKYREGPEAKVDTSIDCTGWVRVGTATGSMYNPVTGARGTCFKSGQYVVSIGHVVKAGKATAIFGDQSYDCKVVKYYQVGGDGITILSPESPIPLPSIRPTTMRPGTHQPGYVVGMGAGGPTLSAGQITADGTHFCTTTFGHSGSPVCTSAGTAIGVHQGGMAGENNYLPFTSDMVAFLLAPPAVKSHSLKKEVKQPVSMPRPTGSPSPSASESEQSDSSDEEERGTGGLTQTGVSPAVSSTSSTKPSTTRQRKKKKSKGERAPAAQPGNGPSPPSAAS